MRHGAARSWVLVGRRRGGIPVEETRGQKWECTGTYKIGSSNCNELLCQPSLRDQLQGGQKVKGVSVVYGRLSRAVRLITRSSYSCRRQKSKRSVRDSSLFPINVYSQSPRLSRRGRGGVPVWLDHTLECGFASIYLCGPSLW